MTTNNPFDDYADKLFPDQNPLDTESYDRAAAVMALVEMSINNWITEGVAEFHNTEIQRCVASSLIYKLAPIFASGLAVMHTSEDELEDQVEFNNFAQQLEETNPRFVFTYADLRRIVWQTAEVAFMTYRFTSKSMKEQ